jgi:ATP phosphoribosyltransferase
VFSNKTETENIMPDNKLKLGIPKGSLEAATVALFQKAGWKISISSRSYFPSVDDAELSCSLVRAQEMARYVETGVIDAGLTGLDWVLENNSDVEFVTDLIYSKVSNQKSRWVLAVPADSPINKIEDLKGKRVSTELVSFTQRYFAERKIPVEVEFSWGATEAKVVGGLVDAMVDITETGSTIKANGLKIIHTLLETNTKLIANKNSIKDPWKKTKIRQIALLLNGALNAESMVGLKMNVRTHDVEAVCGVLPALTAPTISHLKIADWVSVETVIGESVVREIIPQLISLGADGIVEYPINKIVSKKDWID